MSALKRTNVLRRIVLSALTKNIGSSTTTLHGGKLNKEEVKRVLIIRPNHRLGNQLLITPVVQEVQNTFPNCKIDLFVKGFVAPIIFKNYENIGEIFRLPKKPFKELIPYLQGWLNVRKYRYDIVINVEKGSSSGRLLAKFSRAKYKFYGDDVADSQFAAADYLHIAKRPVCSLRDCLFKLGVPVTDKMIPSLDLKLSTSEIDNGKKILQDLTGNKEAKTICLFTFATGLKCYTKEWWAEFYGKLKLAYPHFNMIEILPVENVSQIDFKEPSFYSKDVREMAAVIANTAVFIGADSGIMHLASSAKIPTLGLFSVMDPAVYEPYNNGSRALNTNKLSFDEMMAEIDNVLSAK